MTQKINILVKGESVLEELKSWEISMAGMGQVPSVKIDLVGDRIWRDCRPAVPGDPEFGSVQIRVLIGTTEYQFLLEERTTNYDTNGISYSVWGRMTHARLTAKYSSTVTDTDTSEHPWQTEQTTPSAIIDYVTENYCDWDVDLDWLVEDYPIAPGLFSASNQSPLAIIKQLAAEIGADVMLNWDGTVIVQPYEISGPVAAQYQDLDEIVTISESVEASSGINSVLVEGIGGAASDDQDVTGWLSVEAKEYGEDEEPPPYVHEARIYFYHSEGLAPSMYPSGGGANISARAVESVSETVDLIWGKGSRSKPDIDGDQELTGSENTPWATVSTTYSVAYQNVVFSVAEAGEYKRFFYFPDKSAHTLYSFTVDDPDDSEEDDSEEEDAEAAKAVLLEWKEDPGTVRIPATVKSAFYVPDLTGAISNSAGTPPAYKGRKSISKSDDVLFRRGVGETSYPVYMMSSTRAYPQSPGVASGNIQFIQGRRKIIVPDWYDVPLVVARIAYLSEYELHEHDIPEGYDADTVVVSGSWGDMDHEISAPTDPVTLGLTTDVLIAAIDYHAETGINNAVIYVDYQFRANTDENGEAVIKLTAGDHQIKITHPDYIPTDEDDLSNDTFTVSI